MEHSLSLSHSSSSMTPYSRSNSSATAAIAEKHATSINGVSPVAILDGPAVLTAEQKAATAAADALAQQIFRELLPQNVR